ncbi:MAG: hypothetical protein P0S96_02275 [Simkaniaceae bacterium]|nr:hypothetical protein [Candidatus Sacchlamyda saccharinae]
MSNDYYEIASSHVEKSWQAWEANSSLKAWGHTIPARLAYLCESVINAVSLPFAIIAITLGSLHALCTWDRKSEIFQDTYATISKVANRLFLSGFGALVSPAVTHKYRDANITPFIIAARVVVISGGLLYAFLNRG